MPDVVFFDPDTNDVLRYILSIDPSRFAGRSDVLVFDDRTDQTDVELRSLLDTLPILHLKRVGTRIEPKTIEERASSDAARAEEIIAQNRSAAKILQESADAMSRLIRAVVKLTVDEINVLRARDRARAADVASATNLADLKTRWADQSQLADRTYAQAKTAIENLVDRE